MSGLWRSRWAAVGAAVAVSLGAGGLGLVRAEISSGEKPVYVPINPCRLSDTRPAPDNVGGRTSPIGPEESYTLTGWGAVGNCNLPNGTAGLALNVTAVGPSDPTYLTLYPTGSPLPLTSNLNPTPGQPPTPNAVNVDLNGSGQFDVYNKYGSVHVIVDVVGYYDDHNHNDLYYTKAEIDAALAPFADAASFVGGEQNLPLTDATDVVVRTISLTPPADGTVIVTASGNLQRVGVGLFNGRCSLSTTTAIDFDHLQLVSVDPDQTGSALAVTRGFDVTSTTTLDVNLVCDASSGTGAIRDTSLTAIFAPT